MHLTERWTDGRTERQTDIKVTAKVHSNIVRCMLKRKQHQLGGQTTQQCNNYPNDKN